MSKLNSLIFILSIILLFSSAKCENDDTPIDIINELPPETQTGEQTFACLINGEPFVPSKLGRNSPRAFYQYASGAYTLGISAGIGGGVEMITVLVGGIDIPELTEGRYSLTKRQSGNFHGEYLEGGGLDLRSSTSSDNPGELIITNFDRENFIISGTFSFTIKDENDDPIEITAGRFDLNYTN